MLPLLLIVLQPVQPDRFVRAEEVHQVALVDRTKWPEAAECWRAFLKESPSDRRAAEAHYWLGCCLRELNDPDGCLAAFRAADPRSLSGDLAIEFHLDLGHQLYQRIQSDPKIHAEALAVYERLATLCTEKPLPDEARFVLSALLRRSFREPGEAASTAARRILDLTRDLKLPEVAAEVAYLRAEALDQLRDWGAAADEYERFRRAHPDHPQAPAATLAEGLARLHAGQNERAIELLKKQNRGRSITEVRFALGEAYFRQKDQHQKAEEMFALCAADAAFAQRDLAALRVVECLALRGEHARAVALARPMLSGPLADRARLLAADSAYRLGDHQTVVDLLNASRSATEQSLVQKSRYHLSERLAQAEDWHRAAEGFEQVARQTASAEDRLLAWTAAGRCWFRGQAWGRAVVAIQRQLEMPQESPARREGWLRLGLAQLEMADARAVESIAACGSLAREEGQNEFAATAILRAGAIAERTGQIALAGAYYLQLAKTEPSVAAWDGLARLALARQDHAALAEHLMGSLPHRPEGERLGVRQQAALALERAGDPEAALDLQYDLMTRYPATVEGEEARKKWEAARERAVLNSRRP